jgi:hypothetical protein
MKILTFNKAGDPADVLSFSGKEKPAPGDNEVLIKVLGSPIQPADVLFIEGRYRFKPEFPQTAGLEGAGSTGLFYRSQSANHICYKMEIAYCQGNSFLSSQYSVELIL